MWLGTKWVIQGALGVAQHFQLSHTFVGLAILAVGTDLPEVFVSINASIQHLRGVESSGIITGNALGSSLSQITLVLGLSGLFLTFRMSKKDLNRNGITLISSIVLLFVFGLDGIITQLEGAVLFIGYILYYIVLLRSDSKMKDEEVVPSEHSKLSLALYLLVGFVVLIFSSHLVVNNSMELAEKWGVAQSFVGIVIIGLGTSLPELAVSIGAAYRRSAELSVGNIIGSNIFDGLVPIGLGGMISTTKMEVNLLKFDMPVLLFITLLVLLFLRTKRGLSKFEGLILVFLYLVYIALKIAHF